MSNCVGKSSYLLRFEAVVVEKRQTTRQLLGEIQNNPTKWFWNRFLSECKNLGQFTKWFRTRSCFFTAAAHWNPETQSWNDFPPSGQGNTEAIKKLFSILYETFNNGNIYLTWAWPFRYYQPCNWIDSETENKWNLKSENVSAQVVKPKSRKKSTAKLPNTIPYT